MIKNIVKLEDFEGKQLKGTLVSSFEVENAPKRIKINVKLSNLMGILSGFTQVSFDVTQRGVVVLNTLDLRTAIKKYNDIK